MCRCIGSTQDGRDSVLRCSRLPRDIEPSAVQPNVRQVGHKVARDGFM